MHRTNAIYTHGLPRESMNMPLSNLKKLLPTLHSSKLKNAGAGKIAISSIVLATSHSRSTFEKAETHLHDCPVVNGTAPLYSCLLGSEGSAPKCQACASFVVHHLACELFCKSFCSKCTTPASVPVPQMLSRQIRDDFSSVDQFRCHLVSFAVSSMRPGRTWITYELNKKRITVLALPCNEVPISLGLWPIGALDMTASTLCNEVWSFMRSREVVTGHTSKSPWSRKSRVSNGMLRAVDEVSSLSLHQIKLQLAESALDRMDWNFVEKQLNAAKTYSLSTERVSAQAAWRGNLEKKTLDSALGSIRSIDKDEYSLTSKLDRNDKPVKADKKDSESTRPPKQNCSSSVEIESEKSERKNKSASNGEDSTKDDPQVIEHKETGIWEYRYKNGNRTFLHPDGLKVYEEKNIRSTVYPDGSALFEYPNGISIHQTKDRRITRFHDGTTKEEPL